MKIQISYDSPDIRSGYLVLENLGDHSTDLKRTKCDISFIDPYVANGEAEEILVLDVLTYYQNVATIYLLNHWTNKIAINGIMTISDIDSIECARALTNGNLSIQDYNILVHGTQNQPWLFRKTCLSLNQLVEYFEVKGWKILTKKINNFKFVILAQRVN